MGPKKISSFFKPAAGAAQDHVGGLPSSVPSKRKLGEALGSVDASTTAGPVPVVATQPQAGDSAAGVVSDRAAPLSGAARTAGWLNQLSDVEARHLDSILNAGSTVRPARGPNARSSDYLRTVSNRLARGRTGQWWLDWASCRVSSRASSTPGAGHPRLQVDIGTTAPGTLGGRIRAVLLPASWEALKGLTEGRQVKLQAHHVAYNATRQQGHVPIPLNSGQGGSISHFCDVSGCVKPNHLGATPQHVDNMARQRCKGVVLVVLGGEIIAEKLCSHASDPIIPAQTDDTLLCCRRLDLVFVDRPDLY